MLPPLHEFLKSSLFSTLDRQFARFVAERDGDDSAAHAAALASYQLGRGHVFLDLTREPRWETEESPLPLTGWPAISDWQERLSSAQTVGEPGANRPLILTPSGKLYLHRYWGYEKTLADALRARSGETSDTLPPQIEARLQTLFSNAPEQRDAARRALVSRFTLISGGPGTGKTSTVLKILLLLLEWETGGDLTIHLAAPTGKAAARLHESLLSGLRNIECDEETRRHIPETASTIHRLLKPIPGSVFFRHDKKNPLPANVLVVDEASMVDLPLMAKLFDALPDNCRIILLGDKDQLASVEAGSVLAGIVDAAASWKPEKPPERAAPAKDGFTQGLAVSLLTRNFRFGNDSGIFRLCNAVRDGDVTGTMDLLHSESHGDISWRPLPAPEEMPAALHPFVLEHFAKNVSLTDPEDALDCFGVFQILSAVRQGPYGKETLNAHVENILRHENLVTTRGSNFPGRPLLVTENDYALRLFNGDVGVVLNGDDGKSAAYFRNDDGSVRAVSPTRLPFAEPAFAMTVHKSQGSEFDHAMVILPDRDSPILTRELVYTAISRARSKVTIWAAPEVFERAVSRRVDRASGLADF